MNQTTPRWLAWLACACLMAASVTHAQVFTRITSGTALVTDPVPGSASYTGCAWADYDNDGDPDLYVVQQGLYRNDGGGNFTRLAGVPADHAGALGCSWADFDNDGDPDLFVSGGLPGGSVLLRNEGGDVFVRVTAGVIGQALSRPGFGCAWADYDRDGFTDLVIAAALGFAGITTPNHLMHNERNGDLSEVDTSAVVRVGTGPFTMPSWNDIDDDGDPDLFLATGPADGSAGRDFLFENRGAAPGQTFFRRISTGALATDFHDAQLYNWVDIDADGDLDCYVTNYGGFSGFQNSLYRNTGGVFTKLTAAAGPIVTDAQLSLASIWADLDNDGDMDCVVTNDAGQPSVHYTNDGTGVFTSPPTSALRAPGTHYGAAAADYDGDGDVDVYLHGVTPTRGLYRNDSPAGAGWLNVRCVGVSSNRSAIGAKVWMRATIGGVSRRLVQLVSAQNSFGGHGPFELHFGAGDAAVAESLIVLFPSGVRRVLTQVPLRQTVAVLEDQVTAVELTSAAATLLPDAVRLEWRLHAAAGARVQVYRQVDAQGWRAVASVYADGAGRVVHDDHDLEDGGLYEYELRFEEDGRERRLGAVSVQVPEREAFTLQALTGNPARGRLLYALRSRSTQPVQVALVDASGRILREQSVAAPQPGEQRLDLGRAQDLRPGLYWIRVQQGERSRAVRVAVVN